MIEARKARPEEYQALSRVASAAFENPMDGALDALDPMAFYEKKKPPEEADWPGAPAEVRWGAFEGGKAVAGLVSGERRAWLDGHSVPMSCIGAVSTLPDSRRRGAVREVFRAMLLEQREAGVALSYLYPFSCAFYRRFGYENSSPRVLWNIPLRGVTWPVVTEGVEMYDGGNFAAFRAAYEAMPRYNTLFDRREADYYALREGAKPHTGKKQAFLYRGGEGGEGGNEGGGEARNGYIVFERESAPGGGTVMNAATASWGGIVGETVFADLATLRALLGFAKSFEARYDALRFNTPLCLPLDRLVEDWGLSGATRKLEMNGMLRVVDPVAALKAAAYKGSGRAVIEVRDAFLGMDHRLSVAYEDGAATRVEPTSQSPDATYDIQAFSQAIVGVYGPDEMRYVGIAPLPAVFYKKPVFISNYF